VQTLDTVFEKEIRKAIKERIEQLKDEAWGGAVTDYPKYREYCGRIAELKFALSEIIDMVSIRLNKA